MLLFLWFMTTLTVVLVGFAYLAVVLRKSYLLKKKVKKDASQEPTLEAP